MTGRDLIRREAVGYFLLAVIYVLFILTYSNARGRLGNVPQWDDVAYFVDGLRRYYILMDQGIGAFLSNLVNRPPLSPFSTGIVICSYLIFGVYDWSPYALQGVFVFVVVLVVGWYFQDYPLIRRAAIIFVLSVPIMGMAVHEFRPDIVNGFVTALACVTLIHVVTHDFTAKKNLIISGVLFGIALLTKPSASLFTVGMYGASAICAAVVSFQQIKSNYSRAIKYVAFAVAIGFVIALPYYVIAGKFIGTYMFNALVRDKEIWSVAGEWSYHLVFYLVGQGGRLMLGKHVWFVFVGVVASLYFIRGVEAEKSKQIVATFLITCIAWLVPSTNPVKTQFLGATFYWLYLSSFFIILKIACENNQEIGWRRFVLLASVVVLSVAGVVRFEFPPNWGWRFEEGVEARNSLVLGAVGEINQIAKRHAALNVFMPYAGFFNNDNLEYLFLKEGTQDVKINSWFLRPGDNIEKVYSAQFDAADIVIIPADGQRVKLINTQMPSGKHMDEINKILFERADYSLWRDLKSREGAEIAIWAKKKLLKESVVE